MSTNRLQRSHRSTKIPNVKLRPAPLRTAPDEASVAAAEDDAHFRATRDRGVTHGAHRAADFAADRALRPLQGIVLSFTGVEEKRELIDIAEELGATVHADLTSAVTHLIAHTPGSPKYHAAVRFHMHVVQPEWVYRVREAWLSGADRVPLDEITQSCRLLPLARLVVAATGLEPDARAALGERLGALGATLAPRLVWDGSISHLVCGEACVAATTDARQPGAGLRHTLAHRALARTDSTSPRVQAALRLHLVRDAWVEDCARAGALLPESDYDATAPAPSDTQRDAWVAALQRPKLTRTSSGPSRDVETPALRRGTLVRAVTSMSRAPVNGAPRAPSLVTLSRAPRFSTRSSILAPYTFAVDMGDDARTARVAAAVRGAGGEVRALSAPVDYAVGPLSRPARATAHTYVTHHWVERCVYLDELVDPAAHVALRPATRRVPCEEAHTWVVAVSGLDRQGPDYFHTCAAIHALGGTVVDSFSRRATHLFCVGEARHGPKAKMAEAWGTPLLDYDDLERLLRGEARRAEAPHHEGKTAAPSASAQGDDAVPAAEPRAASADLAALDREPISASTGSVPPPQADRAAPPASALAEDTAARVPPLSSHAGTPRARSTSPDPLAARRRVWTRTVSDPTLLWGGTDAAAGPDAARRRTRPRRAPRRAVRRREGPRPDDAAWSDWPGDAEPAAGDDAMPGVPQVSYDDPAARREHTRLLALVDGHAPNDRVKRTKR